MSEQPFGTIIITDTEWHLIGSLGISYTLRNIGSYPIGIYYSTSHTTPYPEPTADTIIQIGGFTDLIRTPSDKYIWVRALTSTPINLRYCNVDTLDPDTDVSSLSSIVASLITELYEHKNAINPHNISKDTINLSNIPNAISSSKDSNDTSILATTAMVHNVLFSYTSTVIDSIITQLNNHIQNFNNPHQVTQAQVGLDKVLNETIIMPKATIPPVNVAPHSLYEGTLSLTPPGWTVQDIDPVPSHIIKIDNNHIKIKQDTRYIYTFDSRCYVSYPLIQDYDIQIPQANLTYYIYADLFDSYMDIESNDHGKILNIHLTDIPPSSHPSINQGLGDWFNISQYKLLNLNNKEINRIYIGKIIRLNNILQDPIPIPFGNRFISPVLDWSSLTLGSSTLIPNPFPYECTTIAQVNFNNSWQETSWNDQIGVKAYPLPNDPSLIKIQIGSLGWLASSSSSGNPSSNTFTITTPLQTRVLCTRTF
jgi:hypothetical protein